MFDFLMLISAIVLLSLDFVYLSVMKGYFENQVKKIQGTPLKIRVLSTAICYIFLIAGLNYFIIKPHKSVNDAFLLGIVIYGVYETTNYALFSNWSLLSVIIDTLWGGLLFASTTFIVNKLRGVF
jgi:uncharacterized membrane protein